MARDGSSVAVRGVAKRGVEVAVRQIGRGRTAGPSEVAVRVLQVAGVGWVTEVCGAMLGEAGFQRLGSQLNCWCVCEREGGALGCGSRR